MAEDIGYISDASGDLDFENGTFKKGDCTQQNIERLLKLNKGDLRMYPKLGCALRKYQNAPVSTTNKVKITKSIRQNLTEDGAKIRTLQVPNFKEIIVEAVYNE